MIATSGASEILTSLSHYLWPAVVAVLLWKLFPVISEVMKTRAYKVSVGGIEVDVQTASEGLQKQINDLQNHVAQLRERESSQPREQEALRFDSLAADGRILWVDDNPDNNVFEIQSLEEKNVAVTTAVSTPEALKTMRRHSFSAIITDLGRAEGDSFNPGAGVELIEAVRKLDREIPIFVFTTENAAREQGAKLRAAGASSVTASSVDLLTQLGAIGEQG